MQANISHTAATIRQPEMKSLEDDLGADGGIMKLSDYIKPHPGPQTEALKLIGKGKIVFYGGSRGGGKAIKINDLALTDSGWKKVRGDNI